MTVITDRIEGIRERLTTNIDGQAGAAYKPPGLSVSDRGVIRRVSVGA